MGTVCAWAERVTPEQAGKLAMRVLPDKTPAMREWKTAAVFGATDRKGHPYLYAVHSEQQDGYVLVSGDDRYVPVLGYSESGPLDETQMPEHMRAWLQGYIDEMRYLDSVGYTPSVVSRQPSAVSSQMSAISPLVETTWNQSSPYNLLCPMDNSDARSVTGCVATAMAQVINYHMQHSNAPTSIIAEMPSYTTKSQKLHVDSVPAGTSLPDKSLLLNSYGSSATDAQKTAVAQLMLYCGTAVQMNYSSSSSGAASSKVPVALINYFGFDGTARQEKRANYSYASWMELVYDELASDRPVYYSGSSSGGGHAFVIDGYDGNGLFHVNWGWGGSSNDYFALSVLNPDDDSQIGASLSSDGYTIDQAAVIGVQINTGETIDHPICLTTGNLRVDGQDVLFSAFNHTGETYSFNAGIGFIDAAGNITHINHDTYDDLKDNYGYNTLRRTVPTKKTYANKTMKIVPISRKASLLGKWYTGCNPAIHYFIAKYDANGVPTLTAHPASLLQIDTMYVPTSRYTDEWQSVKVQVTNSGEEFYGKVYFFATLADTVAESEAEMGLTALVNSTQTVTFEWLPKEAGTYRLILALDSKGETVLGESTVTIKRDASLDGKTLAIMDYTFENEDRSTFRIDDSTGIRSMDVYGSLLKGKVKIKNLSSSKLTNYQIKVYVEKYNEQTGKYISDTWNSYYTISLAPGATGNLTVNREVTVDNTYRICIVLRSSPSIYLDDRYVVHMRSSKPEPTAVPECQESRANSQKLIRDGQLIILRNGREYTLQGQLIR